MPTKRVGIIGAGTSGKGIAQTIASTGIEVYIIELTEQLAKEAISGIEHNIDAEIAKWGMTESDKRAIVSRISSTTDLSIINKIRDDSISSKLYFFLKKFKIICLPFF